MKSETISLANPRDATKSTIIKMMIISFYSFLICRAKILGIISPFGISFTASLPLSYAFITFLGSVLGYSVLGFTSENIVYLLSLILVIIVKFVLEKNQIKQTPILLSIITIACSLSVNLFFGLAFYYSMLDIVMRICESIIAGSVTYFSCIATSALFENKGVFSYSNITVMSSVIMVMLGIIAFMDIQFGFLNVGVVLAITLLYVLSYKLDIAGSAICAIIIGVTINLYSIDYINFASIIVISTLVASLFKKFGRIFLVGVFITISIFTILILGVTIDILYRLIEILLASGLFLSIKKTFLKEFNFSTQKAEIDKNLQDNIENKLEFAAYTIDDLYTSLKNVSAYLSRNTKQNVLSMYKKTIDTVCDGCVDRKICYNTNKKETSRVFIELTEKLKKGGVISENDITKIGLNHCNRKKDLAEKLDYYYKDFIEIQKEKRRISELRAMSLEQLSGISQMLWEVSDEISQVYKHDNVASSIVRDIFTDLSVEPDSVYCNINKFDRMEIDIYTLTNVEFYEKELTKRISSALKREFCLPSIFTVENKVKISFYEKENLQIDFGAYQIPKEENEKNNICGDSYEVFRDNKGNIYIILSDGMGCGKRAALDSALTCSIIVKLLKAGLSLDAIIKFVNTSLQSKSTDEVLSTIDIVKVDLYTGITQFYKAGCASSFVCVEGIVAEVKTTSLPAGIINGVEFDKSNAVLDCGDIIVLVSDGILEISIKRIKEIISKNEKSSAQEIAKSLCNEVRQSLKDKDNSNDDLTALVLKLQKGI